jgi:membrane fusion protein YbhG
MSRHVSNWAVLPTLLLAAGCGNGSHTTTIHSSGHIEATEVRIAAKVAGKLLELPFQEGDSVKAGQVVARLDTSDAEHQLAQARGELEAASAHLSLLLAGTREEDLERAAAQLARDDADLANARVDRERLETLADRGTATLKARDDARARVAMLEQGVNADRAHLAELKAGPRRQEIEQARGQQAAAEAAAAAISQRIADATVTAPRDGVITERVSEPGEVLPAGGPLYVLTDLAHPWLNAYVDEPALASIHLGDRVTVRVDGHAEPFTGTVTFVSQVAEFTPKNVQTPEERAKLVFRIKVGLDNASGVFKPGMPADAYFEKTGTGDRGPGTATRPTNGKAGGLQDARAQGPRSTDDASHSGKS